MASVINRINAIFFSEFHPTLGPRISCQAPEDYVSKEDFDAVSVYIIPKEELDGSIITVNVVGHKIIGYPVWIKGERYPRNALIFNLCFVCSSEARTVQYELVVKKLAEHLVTMEMECGFLSNETSRASLPAILKQVKDDLNKTGFCSVSVSSSILHLKVAKIATMPAPVLDHHVPSFIVDSSAIKLDQWDLTTQQILPHIDGHNHVAKIAAEADADSGLVKSCIQNLLYYGIVQLVPIFLYSNVYAVTPKLRDLAQDQQLMRECISSVAKLERHPPAFRDVFQMYSSMNYGTTVRELCVRFNPHTLRIDEHKLVQFGVSRGLIRRIEKYPVYQPETRSGPPKKPNSLQRLFTGIASYDELCCRIGLSHQELDEKIENDPDVYVIWK